MTVVKYRARLPQIPGVDLLHPTRSSAEREVELARKAGYDMADAGVDEVLIRRAS